MCETGGEQGHLDILGTLLITASRTRGTPISPLLPSSMLIMGGAEILADQPLDTSLPWLADQLPGVANGKSLSPSQLLKRNTSLCRDVRNR